MPKKDRTFEAQMAPVVLKVLDSSPTGVMSIDSIISKVPDFTGLTEGDLQPSKTREGEALWEQIVRNIRSHSKDAGNYIHEGYISEVDGGLKITSAGRTKAQSL